MQRRKLQALASMLMILSVFTGPAQAQNATPASAAATERDLRNAVAVTSKAFGAFHEALGLEPQAMRDGANAACVASTTCSLATALQSVQASADEIREEVRGRQSDDTRLGGSFAGVAAQGLAPAVQVIPEWVRLSHAVSNPQLKRQAPALSSAASAVSPALLSTLAALKAAIAYLNFSGVPTAQLQASLAEGAKGL